MVGSPLYYNYMTRLRERVYPSKYFSPEIALSSFNKSVSSQAVVEASGL